MKRFRYLSILLAVFLLYSCEKFIDLQPLSKVSTNDYWKTSADLKNYIVQFYPSAFPYSSMVAEEAINSDDFIYGSQSSIMNGERVKSTGNWRGDWSSIRAVNIFFANYKKCAEALSSYSQYLGEAYFFKAWFYFNLVKRYGDVPWYVSPLDVNSTEELYRPRDPRNVVVDSILACLDKATTYLGIISKTGNNRINKETALAFKTRVALHEASWEKYHANDAFKVTGANPNKYFLATVAAAEELMNGSTYAHELTPWANYYTMFGAENMNNMKEVLLWKAFNYTEGYGNSTQIYLLGECAGKGATWELVSSFLDKNGQPYDYLGLSATTKGNDFLTKIVTDCDPRLHTTIFAPGDLMSVQPAAMRKIFDFPPIDQGGNYLCPTGFQVRKTTNPYANDAAVKNAIGNTGYILFRYAEVLLNYAEAKYELDGTVANTQLNLLRARAGMPDFIVIAQSSDLNPVNYGYTVSDALYEIRRERRVELALEGFRDEDYMRWAAATLFNGKRPKGYPFKASEFPAFTPKMDANGLIDYYQKDMPNGYQFRVGTDYLYSIPQDEITINPALNQNPGW